MGFVKLRKGSFPAPVTGESPAQSVEGGRTLGEGQHPVSVAVKQQEHLLVVVLEKVPSKGL